jgi:hypothetical protein
VNEMTRPAAKTGYGAEDASMQAYLRDGERRA